MSSAFDSIKQGVTEAIDFAKGSQGKAIVHEFSSVDVKAIRKAVGMSQSEFSSAFGISLGTLRHNQWPIGVFGEPFSIRLNVWRVKPNRWANSSWLSFLARRASFNR